MRTPSRPVWYSVLLAALLVTACGYGLLNPHAYRLPTNLVAQARGADLLTLLVAPMLVWASWWGRRGSLRAHLLWLGLLAYVAYTYAEYAFGTPYNDAFPAYVAVLGLSTYGLFDGLLRLDMDAVSPAFASVPRRTAAW